MYYFHELLCDLNSAKKQIENVIEHNFILRLIFQDSLPVLPPGCSSEKPETVQEFVTKAKAALVSVGIVRDTIIGNLFHD